MEITSLAALLINLKMRFLRDNISNMFLKIIWFRLPITLRSRLAFPTKTTRCCLVMQTMHQPCSRRPDILWRGRLLRKARVLLRPFATPLGRWSATAFPVAPSPLIHDDDVDQLLPPPVQTDMLTVLQENKYYFPYSWFIELLFLLLLSLLIIHFSHIVDL